MVTGLPRCLKSWGVESLVSMEIRERISHAAGVRMPVTLTFDHRSTRAIAEYVESRMFSSTAPEERARLDASPLAHWRLIDGWELRVDFRPDGLRAQKGLAMTHADQSYAVHVRGLSKTYGQLHAVQDLDLDVGYGEIFAILGPNGAGKTTTIEILEGHRKRDSGQVRVLGEDPETAGRTWRAKIGIVLQEASDAGMLTVSETVQMFAKCYGKARVPEEVLELVGLGPVSGSKVRTLSGGQRRRLDVALGIIGLPKLVFLDEPTTGFDPEARRQFWDLIRRLAGDGTTILLTTHYLDEAAALADRVAVIARGKLVAVDSPAKLIGYVSSAATVRWMEGDEVHVEETDHPTELIRQRSTDGAELTQLTVTRPTLEDAYLHLIHLA